MSAKRLAALLVLSLGFSMNAGAAPYWGLGVGQATDEEWDDRIIQDGSVDSIALEDTDTGFRLFGGIDLDRNIAIEIGYVSFGEQTAQGASDGSGDYWTGGDTRVESAVEGFDFGLAGQMPLSDNFSLLARVGLFSWDNEITYEDPTFTETFIESDTDLFFGGGAEFHPGGPLCVRGEFSRYRMKDVDLDLVSVSLVYRFR